VNARFRTVFLFYCCHLFHILPTWFLVRIIGKNQLGILIDGCDEMMNDTDTAKAFQKRRRETFRMAIPLALATAVCFAVILMIGISGFEVPALIIPGLAVLTFFFLSSLILIVSAKYRCPKCNKIPWTDCFTEQGGVDLNPEVCSNCHSRLK
jgi:hypothetical protein